jgi:hypothetical protein
MGQIANICKFGFSVALLILSLLLINFFIDYSIYIELFADPWVIESILRIPFLFFFVIFCHQFSKVVTK